MVYIQLIKIEITKDNFKHAFYNHKPKRNTYPLTRACYHTQTETKNTEYVYKMCITLY